MCYLSCRQQKGLIVNEIDKHIGQRLRERRHELNLDLQDVGAACGVCYQQIQKYESAKSKVFVARLWQLAKILEVPVGYFYEGLSKPTDMVAA